MNRRILGWPLVLLGTIAGSVATEPPEFPQHWGPPPAIQTQDYRPLPGGFGSGSSTLAKWIEINLAKDTAIGTPDAKSLFTQSFDGLPDGPPPGEFMVLDGGFVVKHDGTNGFLELPGAPLDSFAVQFGPAAPEAVSVTAAVFGTNKGRRAPTFGVGLGGVSGWKLQVSPGKKAIELLRDQESRVTREFNWTAGTWTRLCLQIRKIEAGGWRIEGKAWTKGENEPPGWQITFDEEETAPRGRAAVFGSPFAGTPIQFDELRVQRAP